MPVLSTPRPTMVNHVNPALVTGEVYRIIKGGTATTSGAGSLFVYCETGFVVYLKNTAFAGGYDRAGRLVDDGFLYEVANITEV